MAGSNVGNLNVKLTLSAEQFAAALVAAGGDVNQFAMKVDQAQVSTRNIAAATTQTIAPIRATSSNFGSLGQSIQATSYAAQDFASQLGTRGLGAGLMAMANNIPGIVAGFGAAGVAIGAFGSVAVQVLGSYLDYLSRAKKGADALAEANKTAFSNRISGGLDRVKTDQSFYRQLWDSVAMGTTGKQRYESLRGMQKERDNTITDIDAQRRFLQQERNGALDALNNADWQINAIVRGLGRGATVEQALSTRPDLKEARDRANQQLKEIADEEKKLMDQREQSSRQLGSIEKFIGGAREAYNKEERQQFEQQKIRDANAYREELNNRKQLLSAPGVGAFDASSAQGFSMIQAAIRSAKDVKNPQLDTIGTATKKTAANTKDIANRIKRLKVATIA